MGLGIALRGSDALWLHPIALGATRYGHRGSGLPCRYISAPYQYPRGSHAFRATIIIARGEQSYLGISR